MKISIYAWRPYHYQLFCTCRYYNYPLFYHTCIDRATTHLCSIELQVISPTGDVADLAHFFCRHLNIFLMTSLLLISLWVAVIILIIFLLVFFFSIIFVYNLPISLNIFLMHTNMPLPPFLPPSLLPSLLPSIPSSPLPSLSLSLSLHTHAQFDYVLVFPLTEGAYADPASRGKDVGERVKWDVVSAVWSKGYDNFSFSVFYHLSNLLS